MKDVSATPAAPPAIIRLVNSAGRPDPRFRPTLIYNEGWLLRVILEAGERCNISPLAIPIFSGTNWFSEAILYTPFKAIMRGQSEGERSTDADGVVGHFGFEPGTKAGLRLLPDAQQLVVVEAKLFSGFRKGVKATEGFDQISRIVACIAETLHRADRRPSDVQSLGLCVALPESQQKMLRLTALLDPDRIAQTVKFRVDHFTASERDRLTAWYAMWLAPTLERIQLHTVTWETAIDRIRGAKDEEHESIDAFYRLCLDYNRPGPKKSPMGGAARSPGTERMWRHLPAKESDGRFLALVNRGGSCSLRSFDARTGLALPERRASQTSFQDAYQVWIQRSFDLGCQVRVNLQGAQRSGLPLAVLNTLRTAASLDPLPASPPARAP